jgi:hypothetical protein
MTQATTILWTTGVIVIGNLVAIILTFFLSGYEDYTPEQAKTITGLLAVGLSVHAIKAFRFFMRSLEKPKHRKFPKAFAITCITVVSVVVSADLILILQQPFIHLFTFGEFVVVFGALQTLFGFYLGSVSDALFGTGSVVEQSEKAVLPDQ